MDLHLNKLESPSPKDVLCYVWLKLSWSSGEEVENVKKWQRDGQTTQQAIRKDHLSFQLRWAKKNRQGISELGGWKQKRMTTLKGISKQTYNGKSRCWTDEADVSHTPNVNTVDTYYNYTRCIHLHLSMSLLLNDVKMLHIPNLSSLSPFSRTVYASLEEAKRSNKDTADI